MKGPNILPSGPAAVCDMSPTAMQTTAATFTGHRNVNMIAGDYALGAEPKVQVAPHVLTCSIEPRKWERKGKDSYILATTSEPTPNVTRSRQQNRF